MGGNAFYRLIINVSPTNVLTTVVSRRLTTRRGPSATALGNSGLFNRWTLYYRQFIMKKFLINLLFGIGAIIFVTALDKANKYINRRL